MRSLVCLLLLLSIAPSLARPGAAQPAAPATTTPAPAKVYPSRDELAAALVRRIDRERRGVGMVIGIIDANGTLVLSHGVAARGDLARPLDGDTLFEIGSITKVFTGIAFTDMVRKGELGADDVLSRHLPEGTRVPARDGREITLASLATHTSGLPRMPTNFAPKDQHDPYVDYGVRELHTFLARCRPVSEVGERVEYSNIGYGLLGHVLARRAGCDYATLIAQRITEPLGMTDTALRLGEAHRARLAQGHDERLRSVPHWQFDVLAGAGGLRSTVRDMLRFLSANLALGGTSPLHETLLAARAPNVAVGKQGSKRASLAFAPAIERAGTRIEWHNGGTGGFHSFMGFDVKARRGVVVLSNCSLDCDDLGVWLLEPSLTPRRFREITTLDGAQLARLAGVYELRPGRRREVMVYRDRVFVSHLGRLRELRAASPHELFDDDLTLEFATNDGPADAVTIRAGSAAPSRATRVDGDATTMRRPVAVDPTEFAGLAGRFGGDTEPAMAISIDRDRVYLRLPDQNECEVLPLGGDRFFALEIDAELTFTRDAQGRATELTLRIEGAEQRARRID